MAVTTFPNEEILWKNKKYAIVEVDIFSRRRLVVSDYWRTAYVTVYPPPIKQKWAMDNPEWFPRYVLDKLDGIVNKRRKLLI